jgi:hypothetical protein
MNLVFCARGYMKPGLSHNWHVQVVHKSHFKTFGTFVVITVVKGLDVEKHGVPIVFASFCTLKENEQMSNKVSHAWKNVRNADTM